MSNGIIVPRRDGLVGEWLLNGNALDTSGNNNTGTFTNGAYAKADRGYQSQTGVLNGTSARLNIPNAAKGGNDVVISVWVYPTSISVDRQIYCESSFVYAGIAITTTGALRLNNKTSTTSFANFESSAGAIPLNQWSLLTYRYNSADGFLSGFVNNVRVIHTSRGGNQSYASDNNVFFCYNNSSNFLPGNGQAARIFNRAIGDDEIQNWYLEGLRKLGGGSMSGLFDGMVGHMNSLDGTELSDVFRGITATRTSGTAATDNIGFTRAITNPNYSYTSITYSNVYSFENSGSGWGIVANPSGVSATACNRTTTLRELFFYNRALSTAEQTAISDLCKLNYMNWFDGPNRISIPENLKASCKLFLEGTVSGTTAYDSSGNGNNGTLVNSPTTQRSNGYKGFVFNGSNTAISTPYALNMNADWTVSVTCIPTVVNTTTNTFISRQGNSTSPGGSLDTYFIILHRSDKPGICFQWRNGSGSGGTEQGFTDTNTAGTPYRITVTHTGTTCKGYRNGVLDWTLNIGTNFTSETNRTIQLGSWLTYDGTTRNNFGNNKTLNPLVHNRVLSDAEIMQDHLSFFIP